MRKIKYKVWLFIKVFLKWSFKRIGVSFENIWKKLFYYPLVGILMVLHIYPFLHSCKNVFEENLVFTRQIFEIFKFNKVIGESD
jgi:hypothetical protein